MPGAPGDAASSAKPRRALTHVAQLVEQNWAILQPPQSGSLAGGAVNGQSSEQQPCRVAFMSTPSASPSVRQSSDRATRTGSSGSMRGRIVAACVSKSVTSFAAGHAE